MYKYKKNETMATIAYSKSLQYYRRKLFNIGEGGGKASKANFNTWGLLQNVQTHMHAHTHVCMDAHTCTCC